MRKIIPLFLVVAALSSAGFGQKLDLGLTAGIYHPVNNSFTGDNAVAIEGNVGFRLASVPFLALYFEIPVAGTLNTTVPASALTSVGTYSSIFIAPGLRLKLAPGFPVSPYVATGGGLARFNRSASQTPAGASSTVNKGVWDIGGGVDMKLAPFLGLRAEVRDFYSGSPELRLSQVTGTFDQRQHNIVGTVGVVVRF